MKRISLICLLGILMIVPGFFSACSDDKDEIGKTSDLVGIWEPVHTEGYETYKGEKDSWNMNINYSDYDTEDYPRVEFMEGGTYNSYYYNKGKWTLYLVNGQYQIKGNKLRMKDAEEEEEYVVTIVSLSSSQLILEVTEHWDGEEYYEKVTYKRVSD
ncbi:lipocalin family protein [Parabacteroides sp.]